MVDESRNSDGIWNEGDTWPGRLEREMPNEMYRWLGTLKAKVLFNKAPKPIIEIGPGGVDEIQELISIIGHDREIVIAETDKDRIFRIEHDMKRSGMAEQQVRIFQGNGWDLSSEIFRTGAYGIAGGYKAILAANNLGIATHKVTEGRALELIDIFFNSALPLLSDGGRILLTAGSTGLMIAKNEDKYVVVPGWWTEAEFARPLDQTRYQSDMWNIWINYLMETGNSVPPDIAPTISGKSSSFKFTANSPYHILSD